MPSNEDDDDPMDSTPYVDAVSGLYPDDAGLTHVRTLLAPLVAEFSEALIEEHAAAAPAPAPPTFGSELTLAFHPPALERGRSCWRAEGAGVMTWWLPQVNTGALPLANAPAPAPTAPTATTATRRR